MSIYHSASSLLIAFNQPTWPDFHFLLFLIKIELVSRYRGRSGSRAERSYAISYEPIETCRPVPAIGDGVHHGHPEDQAVRRGVGRPAAMGLRGSPAQAGQGRRAQGTKTAVRSVWFALRQELDRSGRVHDIHGRHRHHQIRINGQVEWQGRSWFLDHAGMRLHHGHRRQHIPTSYHEGDRTQGLRQGPLPDVAAGLSGLCFCWSSLIIRLIRPKADDGLPGFRPNNFSRLQNAKAESMKMFYM